MIDGIEKAEWCFMEIRSCEFENISINQYSAEPKTLFEFLIFDEGRVNEMPIFSARWNHLLNKIFRIILALHRPIDIYRCIFFFVGVFSIFIQPNNICLAYVNQSG